MTKNIMIVGVGGQGTLLASKMLGYVLLKQGYDVKVSEVHGMSQRGGSVVTYVRYGEKVYSPVIDKGEADVIFCVLVMMTPSFFKNSTHLAASNCSNEMITSASPLSITGEYTFSPYLT